MKFWSVAAICLCIGLPTARAACLQYGPTKVTVSGVISVHQDFGPPNYGEDPKHDSKERHLYLTLDEPVRVSARHGSDVDIAERDVRTMEMAYFSPLQFHKEWIGEHVSVTGTLFHGVNAHHWTRVLIRPVDTRIIGSEVRP